jgi:hypothetical protein
MKVRHHPGGGAEEADLELVRDCLEALTELVPAEAHVMLEGDGGGPRTDVVLEVRVGDRRARYVVEVKRRLNREGVGPLRHLAQARAERGERLLVCADRIGDELGAELRERELPYLDLGGNAFLPGPELYVTIVGRRPATRAVGRGRLTANQVKLLEVYLRDADAEQLVMKDLAKRAGIALGAVGKARERLAELGILEPLEGKRWRVANRAEGLERFAEGWAAALREKLGPRRYRMIAPGGETLEERLAEGPADPGCLLGGERAAAHMTQFLETEHATLHAPRGMRGDVAARLGLVPDQEGPLTLLDRHGRGDEYRLPGLPGVPLAHPLLTWAECQMVPDERVVHTAAKLRAGLLEEPPRD